MCYFISLILSLTLLLTPAQAYSTSVVYTGSGAEEYFITIPEHLQPGDVGVVELSGTFASYRELRVVSDASVALESTLGDWVRVDIHFPKMRLKGSNTSSVNTSSQVELDPVSHIFGFFTGTFDFTVYFTGAISDEQTLYFSSELDPSISYTPFVVDANNLSLIGYTGDEHESFTIPAAFLDEGVWYKVTEIADNAFYGKGALLYVGLPDTITKIGDSAFEDCRSLVDITLPSSVTHIGSKTFKGCKSLTVLDIPSSVVGIGDEAFSTCGSLRFLTFNEGLQTIGSSAFYQCKSLDEVVLPDSVNSLGAYAFYDCSSIKSLNVPEGVSTIETATFMKCSSMHTLSLPSTLLNIEESAFESCVSLVNVEIPDSVTTLGARSFYRCASLPMLTVPSTVTTIGTDAFYGVWNLRYCGQADGAPWGAKYYYNQ